MNKIFITIVVIAIIFYLNSEYFAKMSVNTMFYIGQIDIETLLKEDLFADMDCSTNKFGLTKDACVLAIRTRKDICARQTSNKYPGKVLSTDSMEAILSSYGQCIFAKK